MMTQHYANKLARRYLPWLPLILIIPMISWYMFKMVVILDVIGPTEPTNIDQYFDVKRKWLGWHFIYAALAVASVLLTAAGVLGAWLIRDRCVRIAAYAVVIVAGLTCTALAVQGYLEPAVKCYIDYSDAAGLVDCREVFGNMSPAVLRRFWAAEWDERLGRFGELTDDDIRGISRLTCLGMAMGGVPWSDLED